MKDVTGKNLQGYLNKEIWKPIGGTPITKWETFGPSQEYVQCSKARPAPRDWARFGYLLLKKGRWNNVQIISEANVELITNWPDWLVQTVPDDPKWDSKPNPQHSYAYTLWLNRTGRLAGFPKDAYCASGSHVKCVVCPSLDMVVVAMGDIKIRYTAYDEVFWQKINAAVVRETTTSQAK